MDVIGCCYLATSSGFKTLLPFHSISVNLFLPYSVVGSEFFRGSLLFLSMFSRFFFSFFLSFFLGFIEGSVHFDATGM
ncbi:hypothetical protein QBC45DRAFT_419716 [Copromyces sp. CBS 386.78]|nr:hypothetical protein QBC45DRAFT_419716 [Copromyces sp. CBS 386.78]